MSVLGHISVGSYVSATVRLLDKHPGAAAAEIDRIMGQNCDERAIRDALVGFAFKVIILHTPIMCCLAAAAGGTFAVKGMQDI